MTTSLVPFGTRFGMIEDVRNEMERMWDRFFNGGEGTELTRWAPRMNLSETDKHYEVTIDLPGLKPEEFDIELRHGDLWITGERKDEKEEKGKTWHRVERHYGQFCRMIRLGDDVDAEHVDAEYKDGVLTVIVAKTESAQTKHIAVKH